MNIFEKIMEKIKKNNPIDAKSISSLKLDAADLMDFNVSLSVVSHKERKPIIIHGAWEITSDSMVAIKNNVLSVSCFLSPDFLFFQQDIDANVKTTPEKK